MNKTETTEMTNDTSLMSPIWAFVNYALNRYMPILMVGLVCFYALGFETWEPYLIISLMMFSNSYHFKCGYAHSYLENKTENKESEDDL